MNKAETITSLAYLLNRAVEHETRTAEMAIAASDDSFVLTGELSIDDSGVLPSLSDAILKSIPRATIEGLLRDELARSAQTIAEIKQRIREALDA